MRRPERTDPAQQALQVFQDLVRGGLVADLGTGQLVLDVRQEGHAPGADDGVRDQLAVRRKLLA